MKLNSLSIFIFVFIIFLLQVANLIFIPDWCPEFKSVIIGYATLILTGAGFIAFWYEYSKKQEDFLDTQIEVTSENNIHHIKTKVLNKSGLKKEVTFSLLFISKQDVLPVVAMNNVLADLNMPLRFAYTNEFELLKDQIETPIYTHNAAIIPLPFYYSENVRIGNENPGYSYLFDNNITNDGVILEEGKYSVRFFIFCKGKLHRSTADALVVGVNTESSNSDQSNKSPNIPNRSEIQKTKSNI